MGRIKERAAQANVTKGPPCLMGVLLAKMDAEDRADTEELLASEIYTSILLRVLNEEGHPIGISSLRNHRAGRCVCGRSHGQDRL